MKIAEVKGRSPALLEQLLAIWEYQDKSWKCCSFPTNSEETELAAP